MPKGVEHTVRVALTCVDYPVREPQMPKGVEHMTYVVRPISEVRRGARTSDAERR